MNKIDNQFYQTILFSQLKELDKQLLDNLESHIESRDEIIRNHQLKKFYLVLKITNLYGGVKC